MKHSITCDWIDGMAFSGEVDGHTISIDADSQFGGKDTGPRPKPLLLLSLAGCTGMDVASILGKMKVVYDSFSVNVSGELTEDHPKYYHSIAIEYVFKGKDLPMKKLERAIELSQDKYCGVSALLKKGCTLTWTVNLQE